MDSNSIGIIGGADGPSVVFVATSQDSLPLILLAAAVLVALVLVIRHFRKR